MKEYSNKKKLITNGCSFTRGHFNVKGQFDSRGSWAYWLSDLTGKQLYNISLGGSSNEYIALKLISFIEKQTEDFLNDCFVIVQWTECFRQMVWFESMLPDAWMGRRPEDGHSKWCTITAQDFITDINNPKVLRSRSEVVTDPLFPFFSGVEAALSKTYFSMLSVKNYLEVNKIPYLFFDGLNNHNIEIKRIDERNVKGYLQYSLIDYDELDLLKGYSSDGEVRDLELINEKTISKIYDKNFFTDYVMRYWLDIKSKESNNEYVYDLHPTERAAKEWASLLLNYIKDEE